MRARPRLIAAVFIGIIVALGMPSSLALHEATRLILGWNATTCIYIALSSLMMLRSTDAHIKQRAKQQAV